MDARSPELNGELSVGIESIDVVAELKDAFNKDLEHCRRIESHELAAVPWHQRWFNALVYQFQEQL